MEADASIESSSDRRVGVGSQTLMRGLDVIEAISERSLTLAVLAAKVDLSKTTAHRLATSLVERGYLAFTPREGYRLGPRLLALGHRAQAQTDIVQVARPHIEALAAKCADTVHLGVFDTDGALYLDKIAGQRRINISSRIGERHPLTSTGLGKALLLDRDPTEWEQLFKAERRHGHLTADFATWRERMKTYAAVGRAYDLEENEDQIRCVAAPVRDAKGGIVAAISVSSAAHYMDDARMEALTADVVGSARAISHDLGWSDKRNSDGG